MKKLVNVSEPIFGVVEDFFVMDTEPVLGEWRIKVSVDRQVVSHSI
jgi:hypothetical protein